MEVINIKQIIIQPVRLSSCLYDNENTNWLLSYNSNGSNLGIKTYEDDIGKIEK